MSEKFYRLTRNKFKFKLFLLMKLPAAFFSGVKLLHADPVTAITSVRYKWFTTNPFRSTYFACLSMAAELSTGVLAMAHIYEEQHTVSMLVQRVEADFQKKATGVTRFECSDGLAFQKAIEKTKETGSAQTVQARATGKDEAGNSVANFIITWSLKRKDVRLP